MGIKGVSILPMYLKAMDESKSQQNVATYKCYKV